MSGSAPGQGSAAADGDPPTRCSSFSVSLGLVQLRVSSSPKKQEASQALAFENPLAMAMESSRSHLPVLGDPRGGGQAPGTVEELISRSHRAGGRQGPLSNLERYKGELRQAMVAGVAPPNPST